MNYEYEIKQIKAQLQNLQEIVLRMSRSNTEEVSKREQTTAQVDSLTPYTETKTAYIGDTELVFNNVPKGNIDVYGLNSYYITTYELGVLTISFPALNEVTDITISVL